MLGTDNKPTEKVHKKIRIGDLLVQNKVISENQLMSALAEQKKTGHKLGNTLIELGYIEEQRLLEFLSQQLQIPLIDLEEFKLEPSTVQTLSENVARRYRVIVLENRERDVLVGMADPTDLFAYDELGRILQKRVRQAVVKESQLLYLLDGMYSSTGELDDLALELNEELSENDIDLGVMLKAVDATDAPVFRLLEKLFEDALRAKASDIHIEPEENLLRVRQRIDGVLHETVMNEKRIAAALVQRLKLMANLDISEKRLPQDGRFQIKLKQHSIDVRLSTMPVHSGESVVMRLLDQSAGILDFDHLGMDEEIKRRIQRLIKRPHGLMLVTGPTGSGKTTTLYAALNELNVPENKIITVEDPVEYRLERINQVQVHEQIGLTFSKVLRTALRQDPDIVLIGEMRDLETAQIGLRASITGHFVLSTLHTNSAIGTISRLLDMGTPGYLMASALQAVLAQRLVRKVCADCSAPYELDGQENSWLASQLGFDSMSKHFVKGTGCKKCNDTGYKGRIGVYELLEINGELLTALRNEDIEAFANAAKTAAGFETLAEQGIKLALQGKTSIQEIIRISGELDG
ncbi:MAG: type II/IV secretion system protein [Gammaproteobacteria bacterium]|nr:type II/IV secretion system protein [Gammaproteobacteria bacterium]